MSADQRDTPIIDIAILAGCKALDVAVGIDDRCRHPACDCRNKKTTILAALRAAMPWDLPAKRLTAMTRVYIGEHRWFIFNAGEQSREEAAFLIGYRAAPIMRELHPERFGESKCQIDDTIV